jgi:hypothetical protein
MDLGAVLDVVIGLAFTYLLLGILASAAQELVSTWLNKRPKGLRNGLAQLLAGVGGDGKPKTELFDKVFGHPLIGALAPKKLPSYIPAHNFALAMTEVLKDGSQAPLFLQIENSIAKLPSGSAKQSLTALVTRAGGDIDALQHNIEVWFDNSMDHVSGAYKRFSQYFTLVFGLTVAVVFNVDSITLAKTLWTDQSLRGAVVAAAEHHVDTQPSTAAGAPQATTAATQQSNATDDLDKRVDAAKAQLQKLGLPIGWYDTSAKTSEARRSAWTLFVESVFNKDGSGVWIVIGWLITGLAVSLGAPFWFDSLQNFLRLRNAGPKPARAAVAPRTSGEDQ